MTPQWAVPCPIRETDVRGYWKEIRRRQARMKRTRTLIPMLPQLVAAAEIELMFAERLPAAERTPVAGFAASPTESAAPFGIEPGARLVVLVDRHDEQCRRSPSGLATNSPSTGLPARLKEKGDPWQALDHEQYSLDHLLASWDSDPVEMNYPKMPGEPKRVQPSRDADRRSD